MDPMDPETIANQSASADHAHAHNGSSIVQVRMGLEASTIAIVVSLMLVIGACGVVIGVDVAERERESIVILEAKMQSEATERQAELLKYYLLELDAKFIGAGLKKPEDSIATKLKGAHK